MFEGKNIVITGSIGGIGGSIARAFLREKGNVIIHGRSKVQDSKNFKDLSAEFPGKVGGLTADLTSEEGREKFALSVKKLFSSVDHFVGCVGNGNVSKGAFISRGDWNDILEQNFFSNVSLIPKIVPLMNKKNDRSITFIGSIAGLTRLKAPIAYGVAKRMLDTFVRLACPELAVLGIRINIVHPGNISFPGGRWEELAANDSQSVKNYIETSVPQKRFGAPEEIASLVLFVASPQAQFITGSSFVADGGQNASL
ncbi:MAG TPA: SDR family oxidoreductase [Candidatus Paceibacterota bacterium]